MRRTVIKSFAPHRVLGYRLLDDDGKPSVTIQAVETTQGGDIEHIEICIELDKQGRERFLGPDEFVQARLHAKKAVDDLRILFGDIPLQFSKRRSEAERLALRDWIHA